ncbi:phosphoribosylaminoimidazolesuccinocarboxamide synthase [Actinoplanes teichomyceticus]|uniref:Phosphoribosylaminoimidazole-succinocarboxamide synthase n=1 Tax=Actinoplanes teichomyceticus TaxID=1867 RepID=A0A561VIP9_ACTTI|nr:phosphoribosylaminoimidazolesuccinocarboxamide synthase [Actinoplanes teichomyceticus]TWG11467.1 phosphoribosylaminoimidazole-succinocarboxamide synthase [Actinoplanes teichomyceticus]GIF15719.1 phosphoribosylaminoimidazolesuccinocarboxamide synthase [Actinoplanes teichomyceticus]
MTDTTQTPRPADVKSREPDVRGRSKRLWWNEDGTCLVELVPSLRSFTYDRDEMFDGTGPLRLDFYELAAQRLARAGVRTAFRRRVDAITYEADYLPAPPFEVIVKNIATGSTVRKYPGLFPEGHRFDPPVVKYDFRVDPEDQPIAEDYLRAYGVPVEAFHETALRCNTVLRDWLSPLDLWDFCLVLATGPDGTPVVISEVSPDCMRLRDQAGRPLDKDLFRAGADEQDIVERWTALLAQVRAGAAGPGE